tara:strand:+ start:675 stop:983 length:309 start_codon:yes stop_codon:yes gene_type:complete
LTNNHFSPNAISHKDLNILLNKAKKDNQSKDALTDHENYKNEEFKNLISNWSETSQKILLLLNKEEQIVNKNRNSKSIMALGAMGAHINMALQALKSTDFDQ